MKAVTRCRRRTAAVALALYRRGGRFRHSPRPPRPCDRLRQQPHHRSGVHNPEGDYEIFTMRADGSHVAQLTDNAAFDFAPSWSGDGTKIAFETDRDGNSEIYTMTADGSDRST